MVIIHDSVGYERLGRLLAEQGWIEFFKTGPHREPLYPLMIASAIKLSQLFHAPYQTFIIYFQICILFVTQLLTLQLLRQLKINITFQIIALGYLGFSPALINSMLSLYSEILTYPFVLGIILVSIKIWESMNQNERHWPIGYSLWLGILLAAATLIKGIFEVITPLYLIIFLLIILWLKGAKFLVQGLKVILPSLLIFYGVVLSYKTLNQTFNGQFILTNRAAWAFYGNTARRMEPLNPKRLIIALAYMPGEGVCRGIFTEEECHFWSFRRSDEHGFTKSQELASQGLSGRNLDQELLRLAKDEILKNPLQYGLFMGIEGMKMLFWESTKIGFVEYPPWLTNAFNFKPFKNGLRLVIFLLTFFSLIFSIATIIRMKNIDNAALAIILVFIAIYIGLHSFFFTLTRYSLPIASLFIVIIAHTFQTIARAKSVQTL